MRCRAIASSSARFRAGIRRQPQVRLRRRVRQARIDDDEPRAARLAFDDALRVRIEVVAGLQMRRQQQDRPRVRVIGRRPIRAGPHEMRRAAPRPSRRSCGCCARRGPRPAARDSRSRPRPAGRRGTSTRACGLPSSARRMRPPSSSSTSSHVTRFHSPAPRAPDALQRIQHAIGILELVGRDHALGARAAAAARMHRIAFDLPDLERLLVDVREDPARRLAVEADARNDPVVLPILLRPALRLEVDEVVPLGGIRVTIEIESEVRGQRQRSEVRSPSSFVTSDL